MSDSPDDAVAAAEYCIDLAGRCMVDAKAAATMEERIALVADAQAALSEALLNLRPHAAPAVQDPVAAVAVTTDVLHQAAWSEADPSGERSTAATRDGEADADVDAGADEQLGTVHPIRPPR